MPLVPAVCTQCGAPIEVDNAKEAGICPHCGTAFITEKAINNYITQHVSSTSVSQPIVDHVCGGEKTEAEDAPLPRLFPDGQPRLRPQRKARADGGHGGDTGKIRLFLPQG